MLFPGGEPSVMRKAAETHPGCIGCDFAEANAKRHSARQQQTSRHGQVRHEVRLVAHHTLQAFRLHGMLYAAELPPVSRCVVSPGIQRIDNKI